MRKRILSKLLVFTLFLTVGCNQSQISSSSDEVELTCNSTIVSILACGGDPDSGITIYVNVEGTIVKQEESYYFYTTAIEEESVNGQIRIFNFEGLYLLSDYVEFNLNGKLLEDLTEDECVNATFKLYIWYNHIFSRITSICYE